jgi:hypothetical protein
MIVNNDLETVWREAIFCCIPYVKPLNCLRLTLFFAEKLCGISIMKTALSVICIYIIYIVT